MEVGDMLNARHAAAAADAQLRQQLQQAAHMDARNPFSMNTNHAAVGHHRTIHQDTSPLAYPSLNQSPHNQQMTPDAFMMGPPHTDTTDISTDNGSRAGGEAAPKSFACSTCAKRFARRSDLARHERIHSGVRPHSCDWPGCGKQFIQRSALTVHARVHTGEKPHLCERCGKPFSDSSSLARHRRIHSGTRPYKCPYANCQKTFTRRTTLTRHQTSHTGTVEQAAAETKAKLSNTPTSISQHQDGDFSDNASSQNSTESPGQRPISMSPTHELPPIPNLPRQTTEYGFIPQNGALPPHMRNDFSQSSPRPSPGMNSNSLSGYTSAPHHRPSLTSHPAAYGPPQPLEPPANGTASGSGSPHLTALGWGSPNHGSMPSPGPIDNFPYPDLPHPSYAAATHQLYYPGSNIRRPQSTEPEDYGLRPRNSNSHNILNHNMSPTGMGNSMSPGGNNMGHNQLGGVGGGGPTHGHHMHTSGAQMGVEWSNMPTMAGMHGMGGPGMKEEKFVLQ